MYSCHDNPESFFELYTPQQGGSLLAYKSSFTRQKGHGIGGIFGAIASRLIPIVQKILPHVLPHAKTAVKNIAMDVINGRQPLKDSLKANAKEALKGVGRSLINQSGSGRRRRRIPRKSSKRKKTKQIKKKSRKRKRVVSFKKKPTKHRRLIKKDSIFD